MESHPDIKDAGWKMKIAYMDWQENIGCSDEGPGRITS